jgi:RHS repeat-associated protein
MLGGTTQTFDTASELASSTTSGTATTYAYNPRGDRLTATTSSAVTSYGYNQANQLTSYTPPTGTGTTYTYNGDGLRATKTTGSTTAAYAWDIKASVPLLLTDGTNNYLYGPGGLPIEQINSAGTPAYLLQDQLGSTRLITSATGSVTATYTYDAYGNTTSHTGSATTPLLYAGQYQDTETGFYYLRNRYYDPATGQFLSVDPAVSATQAPYSYADDNPLNYTDPTGLCSWWNLYCEALAHPVQVGITAGLISFGAGVVGLFIAGGAFEAATVAAIAALIDVVAGGIAFGLDARTCLQHRGINGPCLAAVLGLAGLLMSGPEALVALSVMKEPAYQGALAASLAGFFTGALALLTDLVDAFIDSLGSSKPGPCKRA